MAETEHADDVAPEESEPQGREKREPRPSEEEFQRAMRLAARHLGYEGVGATRMIHEKGYAIKGVSGGEEFPLSTKGNPLPRGLTRREVYILVLGISWTYTQTGAGEVPE